MAKNINILLKSKILVIVMMAVLFLLGLTLLLQGFIHTDYYRAQIEQLVKDRTGKALNIKGAVSVSLVPIPTLYLTGVELRDIGNDKPAPTLTVDIVHIRADLGSIFSGAPRAASIILERPALELDRLDDNRIHWDWLNSAFLQSITQASPQSVSIAISEGQILYRNRRTDKDVAIDHIYAQGATGAESNISGSFSSYGHRLQFEARAKPPSASAPLPVSVTFSSDKNNTLQLDGAVDFSADAPHVQGTFTLTLENILDWTKPKAEEKHSLLDQITNVSTQKEEKDVFLPVSFSGQWNQTGSAAHLTNGQFTGLNSAASGTMDIEWTDIPQITTALNFSALDYGQWSMLLGALQADGNLSLAVKNSMSQQENPLPNDMALNLSLEADKLYVGGQTWNKVQLSLGLDKAVVTVNKFNMLLPGEASLSLFGILSPGSTGGLRFEGSMETQGPNLRQMLTVFDESAIGLPELGSGNFSIRSNLYIASDQVRLSEANAKISDLQLNGGLVAYFDANPRLEADVKLKDINFDYFRDSWRKKQDNNPKEFFLKYDKSANLNWLKKLQTNIDFRVNVEHFTFLDRPGDSASFRLFAKEGEFGIYNVHMYYPGDTLEASFSLDAKGEQPVVNVLLNTSVLDTKYFSANPDVPPPAAAPADKRWPETLIDMGWMDGINGTFDISAGKMLYQDKTFTNLKLRAKLENNAVTFQSLQFNYWQGKCSVSGSIYGGTVPGISVGFTLYNAELQEMLQSLTGRDNIGGKVSVSGTLVTSGVNYLSWISQSNVELVVAARGVNVNNFNVQGVADAVAVSRTASDVVNNVNLALVQGSTEMSVDGNLNIRNGVLRTPGVTLKTAAAVGNLTGEMKLVPWTMQLSSLYQFSGMSSETVPTMTIQLSGPIGAPEMQVDTSSLEAYVAKRLVGSSVSP